MGTKLPAFQFYPGDWQKEPTLRCVSHAAKGVYIDMLCLMFECEDRGVLASGGKPWSDNQIAAAVGGDKAATLACIDELLAMGVVCRSQSGAILSRRMVRDEQQRHQAAERKRKQRSRDGHGECHATVTPLEDEVENEDEVESVLLKKERSVEHDDELHGWLVWWNELHSQKLVPAGVCVDKPSEGVLAGWRRVKKSAALRDMLTDRDKLAADIRGSPLLRSGWFRLEKLFGGKNSDGEYILTKLTQGGYRDNGKPTQQQRVGDGQRHNSSGRFTGT